MTSAALLVLQQLSHKRSFFILRSYELEKYFYPLYLSGQGLSQKLRQQRSAVFVSFTTTYGQLLATKIGVFDTQTQGFHQVQTGRNDSTSGTLMSRDVVCCEKE